MKIEKIIFVLHFDALDFEISSISPDYLEEGLIDNVLDSTPLGSSIIRLKGEDDELFFDGDVDLVQQESYFELLNGKVRYITVSSGFEGQLNTSGPYDWAALRTIMLDLRNQLFDAGTFWGAFQVAPVAISIGFFEPVGVTSSLKTVNVNSRQSLIEYLDALELASSNRLDIASFLSCYSPEISRFRQGRTTKFMDYWLSTELLLTQTTLECVESPESQSFLAPVFQVENFAWQPPKSLNPLVEGERSESPEETKWFTPVPANPYRSGSDPYWTYEDAVRASTAQGDQQSTFTKLGFALTMNALATYIDEQGTDDCAYPLDVFWDAYSSVLEPFIELMNEEFDWSEATKLAGEMAEFVEELELPVNAENIWKEYLSVISSPK